MQRKHLFAWALALVCTCAWLGTAAAGQTALYQGQPAKYVFLFIGDGTGFPQLSAAEFYNSAKEGKVLDTTLAINTLPVQGVTTTYSAETPITDSAAAATAIACGVKTYNAAVGMDVDKKPFKTMAELARDKGMKVGIVSSVSIDHATPACFYAHQDSRKKMYEIDLDLANSGFDYFAGGGLVDPAGKKSKNPASDALDVAREKGFVVTTNKAAFQSLKPGQKAVSYNAWLQDAQALPYSMDTRSDDITLAEFTAKGIELLDNPQGFFMMVEGGKIDWACHANDAMAAIADVQAFDAAVQVAMDFASKHPDQTLIVVTGDHECGGLTVGFAGTKYDNYFKLLDGQKISFQKFSSDVIDGYKQTCGGKFNFDDMKPIISENFGLKFEGDAKDPMVLKDFEIAQLKDAYNRSMGGEEVRSDNDQTYLLYGGYDPLTVTITHLLNNKAGLGWTSYSHTAVPVPTAAGGVGAEVFGGYYDNTDLFKKINSVMGVATEPVAITQMSMK